MSKERIIELQKSLKVARQTLEAIGHGASNPESRALEALDELRRLEVKQPLQAIRRS